MAWRIWQFFKASASRGATADECAARLKSPIQSVSTRVSEMARYGLLTRTTVKRRTSAGGKALVLLAREGDFQKYAELTLRREPKVLSSLSEKDNEIFQAGKQFVVAWKSASTNSQRQRLVVRIIKRLRATIES